MSFSILLTTGVMKQARYSNIKPKMWARPWRIFIISSLAVQKFWASTNSHPETGNQQGIPVDTTFKIKLILLNHLNKGNHYEN
jgi:hypothetical protein